MRYLMFVDLPVSALCDAIEGELLDGGRGDEDMSAVARVIRARSGLPG